MILKTSFISSDHQQHNTAKQQLSASVLDALAKVDQWQEAAGAVQCLACSAQGGSTGLQCASTAGELNNHRTTQ